MIYAGKLIAVNQSTSITTLCCPRQTQDKLGWLYRLMVRSRLVRDSRGAFLHLDHFFARWWNLDRFGVKWPKTLGTYVYYMYTHVYIHFFFLEHLSEGFSKSFWDRKRAAPSSASASVTDSDARVLLGPPSDKQVGTLMLQGLLWPHWLGDRILGCGWWLQSLLSQYESVAPFVQYDTVPWLSRFVHCLG